MKIKSITTYVEDSSDNEDHDTTVNNFITSVIPIKLTHKAFAQGCMVLTTIIEYNEI
tara:strand:- start:324 stop:494 length:171 start_codon:yes stop_codon:yes gene_type:complete